MVRAVRRGPSLRAVARQFHVGPTTVQRWVERARGQRFDRVEWRDYSSAPCRVANRVSPALEEVLLQLRCERRDQSALGEFGAAAIRRAAARIEAAPPRRPLPDQWRFKLTAQVKGRIIYLRRTTAQGGVRLLGNTLIPEVTEAQMARAVMRIGGVPIERGKRRVTMFLDAAIIDYFKAKAGARSYQTLMNEVLAEYICGHDLEATLRRIIREELERTTRPA